MVVPVTLARTANGINRFGVRLSTLFNTFPLLTFTSPRPATTRTFR